MAEQIAHNVGPDGIDIAYERFGDPDRPAILLVMGGGAQMVNWPDEFCRILAGKGFQVIRFDNRDSGHSTHFTDGPAPDFQKAAAGDHSTAAYTLKDMANDAVGLLDILGLAKVHVVGMSMGGMIAQAIAIEHPGRVLTLTSISSTTGDPTKGRPNWETLRQVPPQPEDPDDREAFVRHRLAAVKVIGGRMDPDEQGVAERAGRTFDRGHDPMSMLRHSVATLASGDRTAGLRRLTVPTLVIHGTDDPMFDVTGGQATADAIPGAKLVIIDGLGHSFPKELWQPVADDIAELTTEASTT